MSKSSFLKTKRERRFAFFITPNTLQIRSKYGVVLRLLDELRIEISKNFVILPFVKMAEAAYR